MPVDQHNSDHISACLAVGEALSAYLDGELSETEAAAVEAHLRECPDCARLCAALRNLRVELAGAELDPPPALHDRIMTRVRRENRLRRIRRITAAASAGLAAMFCFVIIGGAVMSRMSSADEAAPMAADVAEGARILQKNDRDGAAPEVENGIGCYTYSATEEAMTGGVIDTTLVAELTIAATGIPSDTSTETAPPMFAVGPKSPETTKAPETTKSPETIALPEVLFVTLNDSMRDLSRLDVDVTIKGLSTTEDAAGQLPANSIAPDKRDTLSDLFALDNARLAEEQLGTLCVVEFDGGTADVRWQVYDLTTGERLSLAEFLGSVDAAAALGADADTPYRPTAAGLVLVLPDGEICVAWHANATLAACITHYAMHKAPLCGDQ